MIAPTLPGSATPCRYTDTSPPGWLHCWRKTPITRAPDPSVLTESSSVSSTSMPPCSTNSGSIVAAATRSSPSTTNRPVRPRSRFVWSLRICLSFGLSADVIKNEKGRLLGRPGDPAGAAVRLSGRGLPGCLGESAERLGVAHGDVGQHLAVQLDARGAQAVHELRIAHSVLAGRRVDARDPQATEVALAVAAIAVGVGLGLEQRLLGALVARM